MTTGVGVAVLFGVGVAVGLGVAVGTGVVVGVEGTRSYGAGLAAYLSGRGFEVRKKTPAEKMDDFFRLNGCGA